MEGYWDKCLYLASSKPDYLALDWQSKQDQLWSEILKDSSFGPYPNPAGIEFESVLTSFDDEWDVMPAGRLKYIHSVGSICPFVVNIAADSPYSGMFKSGESHGFIRMGSATPIGYLLGVTPGIGIKFLRSGVKSANFVALNQLAKMDDNRHNFFAVPLRNHLPEDVPIPLIAVALKFCQASKCISKVGLSDVCKYDQDGNEAANLVFPFMVTFEPTGEVTFTDDYLELPEFMAQWDTIQPGTNLYTLKAHSSPEDTEGTVLGQVTTTDKCVSSNFGDTRMFFQHQRIEEDKELRPEWAAEYDAKCPNYC